MSSTGTGNIFSTGNTNFAGRLASPNPMTTLANVAAATQPIEPQTNMIWVHSMDDVLNHVRTPNETLYFEDPDNQLIYIRETDGNGEIKNPLHGIHYEKVFEIPFGQEAKFVTKTEFNQLYNLVSSMSGKLDQLFPTNLGEEESSK